HRLRNLGSFQSDAHHACRRQAGKDAIAIANVDVFGKRTVEWVVLGAMLDGINLLRMWNRQRVQQQAIDDAEDDHVGADSYRQSEEGSEGESWRLVQLAEGVANILKQVGHNRSADREGIFTATRRCFSLFLHPYFLSSLRPPR